MNTINLLKGIMTLLVGSMILLAPLGTDVRANTFFDQTPEVKGDTIQENAVSSERVKVTDGQVTIEADDLMYDIDNGIIEATGNVKVTTADAVYFTESLTYNTTDSSGKMASFKGRINSEDERDFKITGGSLTFSKKGVTLSGASLTRCPLENSHYQFSAKKMSIQGKVVHFEKVVLRIKGVPVFYLPRLTMNIEGEKPDFQLGYSDEDGIRFKYNYLAKLTPNSNLFFDSELTAKDDSILGFGMEFYNNNFKNRLSLKYNLDNYWTLNDLLSFENNLLLFTADAFHDFTDDGEEQYGARLTRKYWKTPVGQWQIGVLARDVSKNQDSRSYGGFYTGWQLDYRPNPNLVISYLGITSHTDGDYGDILEDYGLGDNWLYTFNLPLARGYSLGLNGVYNSDGDGWIHQVYRISQESCCFKTSVGYDFAEESWDLSWNIKF